MAFYGATNGEAFIYGAAGERFCVRNSGIKAVVEAVGDHACEYMTGGRVVVLGSTGRNFAAGMSGGIAYVMDEANDFKGRCNFEMVDLETLGDPEEINEVRQLIERHAEYTGSKRAKQILADWDRFIAKFVRVIPRDYQRVLQAMKSLEKSGLSKEEVFMTAFQENKSDLKRVSGN